MKLWILTLALVAPMRAQLPANIELQIEQRRIAPLRGAPTIQIGLPQGKALDSLGASHADQLARIEDYLKSSGIPFRTAKGGIVPAPDLLLFDVVAIPFGKGVFFYSIGAELLEPVKASRLPEAETVAPVWRLKESGIAPSAEAVLDTIIEITRKFVLDYLRANPRTSAPQKELR